MNESLTESVMGDWPWWQVLMPLGIPGTLLLLVVAGWLALKLWARLTDPDRESLGPELIDQLPDEGESDEANPSGRSPE